MEHFNTTHGHSHRGQRSRTYRSWDSMRDRCLNASSKDYPNYGGRGITICPEWRSFERFLADMGERPLNMSLDREKNSEGYSRANCRWATRLQQQQNRRSCINITFRGRTRCLSDWARRRGLTKRALEGRMHAGWSVHRALTTELRT